MWEAIKYDVENTTYNNIGSMCEAITYGVPNTTYNSRESMWGTIKRVQKIPHTTTQNLCGKQ